MTEISFSSGQSSEPISGSILGANVILNHANLGDDPTNILLDLGISSLRYPGGAVTEKLFDINNPDADKSYDEDEKEWVSVLPQDEFLEFCGENGIAATIVVPSNFKGFKMVDGTDPDNDVTYTYDKDERTFTTDPVTAKEVEDNDLKTVKIYELDPTISADFDAWLSDTETYIYNTLIEAYEQGVTIEALELGNEYLGNKLPRAGLIKPGTKEDPLPLDGAHAHGKIAAELALKARDAIESFEDYLQENEPSALGSWTAPHVSLQAWGPNEHNRDDTGNATEVFHAYIHHAGAQDAIDSLTGHFYINPNMEDDYAGVAPDFAKSSAEMDYFDELFGREMNRIYSEWNVHHHSGTTTGEFYGLQQIAPILEVVSAMSLSGVDVAHFWTTQYNAGQHPTGLYGKYPEDPDDQNSIDTWRTTVIGEFYEYMIDNLIGAQAIEMSHSATAYDLHAFENDQTNTGYLFVSSLQSGSQSLSYDFSGTDASVLSYTEFNVDGYAKDDPMALLQLDTFSPTSNGSFSLGGFEVVLVKVDTHIEGTNSNDILDGTFFGDEIHASGGDDEIRSGAGDDVISDGGGKDIVFAGDGNDIVNGGFGTDIVNLGQGNDIYNYKVGSGARDKVYGGTGDDEIHGGDGGEFLYGEGGDDTIIARDGDDYVEGGYGHDNIWLGSGNDTFVGLSTDAQISNDNLPSYGIDTVHAGSGDDEIFGADGGDNFYGEGGEDEIWAGGGDDLILGGGNRDLLYGEDGDDEIDGGFASDKVWLGAGNDWYGKHASNSDAISGAGDTVYAGTGNDEVYGQNGADWFYGGHGNDVIDGGNGNDVIHGEEGDDILWGGGGEDTLQGLEGSDNITGGTGDDMLYGGADDDILNGGKGADVLHGGQGEDTFSFTTLGTTWGEEIADLGTNDTIRFDIAGIDSSGDLHTFYDSAIGGYVIQLRPDNNSSFIHDGSIRVLDPDQSLTYAEIVGTFEFV